MTKFPSFINMTSGLNAALLQNWPVIVNKKELLIAHIIFSSILSGLMHQE